MGAFSFGRPLLVTKMKKFLSFIICLVAVLSFFACGDKIKTTKVSIQKMTDTTLVSIIDDHKITFDIKKAEFDNGAVMEGDSAVVRYVGNLSDEHVTAVIVKLIPKKGRIVNAVYDPNKKLETAPMTKEEVKDLEKGIEYAKKHQH